MGPLSIFVYLQYFCFIGDGKRSFFEYLEFYSGFEQM